jgi:hypothetical protein
MFFVENSIHSGNLAIQCFQSVRLLGDIFREKILIRFK